MAAIQEEVSSLKQVKQSLKIQCHSLTGLLKEANEKVKERKHIKEIAPKFFSKYFPPGDHVKNTLCPVKIQPSIAEIRSWKFYSPPYPSLFFLLIWIPLTVGAL